MKQHKHAELIKAWADGAEIQFQYSHGEWDMASSPAWDCDKKYRIKPDCEYAFEKIRELGGDEAVDLYKYWLGGGNLALIGECPVSGKILDDVNPPQEDPFKEFMNLPLGLVSKKKQTVKQVLWVFVDSDLTVDISNRSLVQWLDNCEYKEKYNDSWHPVPTCTREIEV